MAPNAVSVVITVLNEASTIDDLLDSLAAQTRRPDEVVLVDAGSTDGSAERAEQVRTRLPLQIVVEPTASRGRGRNVGVSLARYDLIAVSDAGVRLEPHWLERLIAPLDATEPAADVVAGFFLPDPRSPWELALGATTLPRLSDVRPDRFLPSSRSVAFRRSAWAAVGGYPEWLNYCEDLVFDLALREAGCRFAWAPDAIVHFRPRRSPAAFAAQYFNYARGDGEAGLWLGRHAIRYATYLLAPALVAAGWQSAWVWLGAGLAAAAYVRRPYARLLPELRGHDARDRLEALAWVPAVRLIGDLAKMAGYPSGLLRRLRRGWTLPETRPIEV